MGALQPTNNTVVSYNILGMADSDTLPAWRLTSKNSSAGVLTGFLALAHSACHSLIRNQTAMTQLKVQQHLLAACAGPQCHAKSRNAVHKLRLPGHFSGCLVAVGVWG